MPAFPHLTTAEVDLLVTYLMTPAGGRGGAGAGFTGGRGRGAGPVGSGAPPELIAGSGSAWTRPADAAGARGRGAAMPYPEGTPNFTRYTINEYNTVGNKIKPPFTTIVKYDLNEPAIKWRIPYGDDPVLAARGIKGTSVPGDPERPHRHPGGPVVRRRPRQPRSRLGHGQRPRAVVVRLSAAISPGRWRCTRWTAGSTCWCPQRAPPAAAVAAARLCRPAARHRAQGRRPRPWAGSRTRCRDAKELVAWAYRPTAARWL